MPVFCLSRFSFVLFCSSVTLKAHLKMHGRTDEGRFPLKHYGSAFPFENFLVHMKAAAFAYRRCTSLPRIRNITAGKWKSHSFFVQFITKQKYNYCELVTGSICSGHGSSYKITSIHRCTRIVVLQTPASSLSGTWKLSVINVLQINITFHVFAV